MSYLKTSLLGLAVTLAAGCGSEPLRRVDALTHTPAPLEQSASTARQALANASICCDTIADFPFHPLPTSFNGNVTLDASAPAYRFDSGKSFFRAFALPKDSKSFEIRLYSQAGKTVLAPSVMLLDSRLRPTRILDADDFTYAPASGLKGDSLDARLRIDRTYLDNPGNEYYLVLYADGAQLDGQTALEHPAKAYARALGNEPPSLPDPVAQHSPTGVVKMVLIEDKVAGQQANTYVPSYSIGREMGNDLPSVPAPAVLPETQAYYRQGIDAALASKDLERALRLADEAARVGDVSAKAYLLERVEIK
ncbi:MalM family protein [Stutzerimonas xanthomarina]|uniref:Maltose operon protein n=2 Tax=Stutzerimonas xanthomarina TaxID=271420 RepID=A0A1M5P5N1_9GAMM|nr:MalM family protein [Stutzerimonas xanthomarina]MCP9338597.1 MalM family protein [Stutzerimonas xanthomarina]SEH77945.1 maltose operon protein [Stutzerimonas xanthomarina]SHG96729.1 maltose operon protein [Stutzerimonas xanthomarina DSM 18231]